jgi:hypothetical protein
MNCVTPDLRSSGRPQVTAVERVSGTEPAAGEPSGRSLGELGHGNDVDDTTATLGPELDGTGSESEQRVVATTADEVTRVEVRAALADDDLARLDDLAAEP